MRREGETRWRPTRMQGRGLPPPAGARKGLPYKATAVPLRTTRTGLHQMAVHFPSSQCFNAPLPQR